MRGAQLSATVEITDLRLLLAGARGFRSRVRRGFRPRPMSDHIRMSKQLSYAGAALALEAAVAKAREIGVPQNISIVDARDDLLAFA